MKGVLKILAVAVMSVFILCYPAVAAERAEDGQKKDIVKVTGDIYVNEGTTVKGDVITVWGNIYINGSVTGDAVAVFGDVIVNGQVLGDVTTVRGKITVGQNGKILGNIVEAFGDSARRNGGFNYNFNLPLGMTLWRGAGSIIFSLVITLIVLLLSSLAYLIIPGRITDMADTMDSNLGKRIGIGFLAMIGSPVVMIILTILLAITVIGIIVIPFLWIAYMIAGLVALTPVYLYIGGRVGELISRQKITGHSALAAGILSIWLIKTVVRFGAGYTSWISMILSLLILVLGLGTLLDYIFTRRRPDPAYAGYRPYHPQGDGRRMDGGSPSKDGTSGSDNISHDDESAHINRQDEGMNGNGTEEDK